MKTLLKSMPPTATPISGLMTSLTRLFTTPVKAAPIMMPIARSTTLPRATKARNSPIQPGCFGRLKLVLMRFSPCCPRARTSRESVSPALEIGQAAVGVGLDAFLEILGAAQPILLDQLAFGGRLDLVDEAAAHRLARRQDRERGGLGDFEGERLRCAAHLGLRHQEVGEADADGFIPRNPAAGVEQQ